MNSWPIGYVRKRIGLPGGKENEKGSDRGGLLFAGRPLLIIQLSFRWKFHKGVVPELDGYWGGEGGG
jgi:hypothetical protein